MFQSSGLPGVSVICFLICLCAVLPRAARSLRRDRGSDRGPCCTLRFPGLRTRHPKKTASLALPSHATHDTYRQQQIPFLSYHTFQRTKMNPQLKQLLDLAKDEQRLSTFTASQHKERRSDICIHSCDLIISVFFV